MNNAKPHKPKTKIAALGDIHVKETMSGEYHELFTEISTKADVLILCGDLTDHGSIPEAENLAKELLSLRIPVVGVFGNHDYDSGHAAEIKTILKNAQFIFLEDENFIMGEIGITGVKGFGGGFEKHILSPFGEEGTKAFANEAISEALKLEEGIKRLTTKHKIVALHYSPIRDTINGEPLEIFPFLGSSRLVEPIDMFDATVVFHGHADFGTHAGKTPKGIPVYNVALPLMKKQFPKQPYALIEV